jgi:hypothetical protein
MQISMQYSSSDGSRHVRSRLQVHLKTADRVEADLCIAHLKGADMVEADLCLAHLAVADTVEADLCMGADLVEADLYIAHLRGTDMVEAVLCIAHLMGADLVEANLSVAHLLRALSIKAEDLGLARLMGADLKGAGLLYRSPDWRRTSRPTVRGCHQGEAPNRQYPRGRSLNRPAPELKPLRGQPSLAKLVAPPWANSSKTF